MAVAIVVAALVIVGIGLYVIEPRALRPRTVMTSVSDLDEYFSQVVAAKHPPGLSVAAVKDGRIAYAKGFGIADEANEAKATKDTIYHWWSMTKIPTAIAIMQLHERGLLDIDDPVCEYLPFFRVTYKGTEQAKPTIRQVLDHSAGLPDVAPEMFTWLHFEGDAAPNQTDLVVSKAPKYSELVSPPGEKTLYSNWAYMVLGALVEAVSGQTYEEYVVDSILVPLGMHYINFAFTEAMSEREATGSQHLIDMYTPLPSVLGLGHITRERAGMRLWFKRVYNDQTPPTGLIGPVVDIALFLLAYLDDGGTILQPETLALMNTAAESLTHPGESTRGLGWLAHLTSDHRRYLTHGGGGPGFATVMRVYPEESLGVVAMADDPTIDRDTLANGLANMEW